MVSAFIFVETECNGDGVCLQPRASEESADFSSYKIFLLPPTSSVGSCLLPVYLGKGSTGRKESLNVEMTYASEAVNLKVIC